MRICRRLNKHSTKCLTERGRQKKTKKKKDFRMSIVPVSQGFCNKAPQTGWLKQKESILSRFWGL